MDNEVIRNKDKVHWDDLVDSDDSNDNRTIESVVIVMSLAKQRLECFQNCISCSLIEALFHLYALLAGVWLFYSIRFNLRKVYFSRLKFRYSKKNLGVLLRKRGSLNLVCISKVNVASLFSDMRRTSLKLNRTDFPYS